MAGRRDFLRALGGTAAAAWAAGCSRLRGPDVSVAVPAESYVGTPLGVSFSELPVDADLTLRVSATDVRDEAFVGEFAVADDGSFAGPVEGEPPAARAIVTDNSDPPDAAAVADAKEDLRMPLASLRPRNEDSGSRFVADTRDTFKESVELEVAAQVGGRETDATKVTRRLVDPDVSGEDVASDDLVGRLYEPSGDGPHPGVLVLHGDGANTSTEFATLLAAHGYAALALKYFDGPGLPETLVNVPLEYFERAVAFLTGRDGVHGDRVGLVGVSKGVEAALLTGAGVDIPAAVVGYSGSGLVMHGGRQNASGHGVAPAWTRDGEAVVPSDTINTVNARISTEPRLADVLEDGVDRIRSTGPADRAGIPVENIDGPVALLTGLDDQAGNSPLRSEYAVDRLRRHDHDHPYVHATYEGAGHFIFGPYEEFADSYGGFDYGGAPVPNAHAGADGFLRTLDTLDLGLRG